MRTRRGVPVGCAHVTLCSVGVPKRCWCHYCCCCCSFGGRPHRLCSSLHVAQATKSQDSAANKCAAGLMLSDQSQVSWPLNLTSSKCSTFSVPQRTPWGCGGKRRGEENPHEGHPSRTSLLCFSCTRIHGRADQKIVFGGVQKISGGCILWYVFLLMYVLHSPISWPEFLSPFLISFPKGWIFPSLFQWGYLAFLCSSEKAPAVRGEWFWNI